MSQFLFEGFTGNTDNCLVCDYTGCTIGDNVLLATQSSFSFIEAKVYVNDYDYNNYLEELELTYDETTNEYTYKFITPVESFRVLFVTDGSSGVLDYVFTNCVNLHGVLYMGSVFTRIANTNFTGCTLLAEVNAGINLSIIDSSTFTSSHTAMTSFYFPNSNCINVISSNAFAGTNIVNYTVPTNVTIISSGCFSGCKKLIHVEMHDAVTAIYSKAFDGCTSLSKITIGSNVTQIASDAFNGCDELTDIIISSDNTKYKVINNCIVNKQTNQLVWGNKYSTIPVTCTSVGPNAFTNSVITSVNFNGTNVTELGNNAFSGCKNLETVIFSNNLTTIGNECFSGCTSLTTSVYSGTLTLNGVTTIGDKAFSNSGINTIQFGKNLTSIGIDLFSGTNNLSAITTASGYNTSSNTFYVTGNAIYKKNSSTYSLYFGCKNTTFNLSTCTDINTNAFNGCIGLTSVSFANTKVANIGKNAFYGCTALATLNLSTLSSNTNNMAIGIGAFYGCTNLASITFGSKIGTIASNAFANCSGLTSISIPGSVTSIDKTSFSGCKNIASVSVDGNTSYNASTPTTTSSIIDSSTNKVIFGTLNSNLFDSNNTLTEPYIIGESAFAGMTVNAPDELYLSDFITNVNDNAFNGSSLSGSVVIGPVSVSYPIDSSYEGSTTIDIGKNAFANTNITDLEINRELGAVGIGAFSNCKMLENVNIGCTDEDGNEVSGFGNSVPISFLEKCESFTGFTANTGYDLSTMEMPSIIGKNAFADTSIDNNGASAIISKASTFNDGCFKNTDITRLNFTNLDYIGRNAFGNCPINYSIGLTNQTSNYWKITGGHLAGYSYLRPSRSCIVLGSQVPSTSGIGTTVVGEYAFYGRGYYGYNSGESKLSNPAIDYFEDYCFAYGTLLELYRTNTENVAEFCDHSFYKANINTIVFRQGDILDESAFEGSTLSTITTYSRRLTIGKKAFANCNNLTSISSLGWYYLGDNAFNGCTNLTSITTTANCSTNIGASVFGNCPNLETLTVNNQSNTICSYDFSYTSVNCNCICTLPNIYGKSVLMAGCKTSSIPGYVTRINDGAFEGCTGLTDFAIPSNVKEIGKNAFKGCTELEYIYLGGGIEKIEDGAFSGCTKLKGITIPDSCTIIGDGAFSGCTSLSRVTFPDTFNVSSYSIPSYAFSNCYNLRNINLPEGLTSIGKYAFQNTDISGITIPSTCSSLGEGAFSKCYRLGTIVFKGNVTSMGNYVFNLSGIKDMWFYGHQYYTGNGAWSKCVSYWNDRLTTQGHGRRLYAYKTTYDNYLSNTIMINTYSMTFVEIPEPTTLTLTITPSDSGTVYINGVQVVNGGTYACETDEVLTLSAIPNVGYAFSSWNNGESTTSTYTYTVTSLLPTVTAEFTASA